MKPRLAFAALAAVAVLSACSSSSGISGSAAAGHSGPSLTDPGGSGRGPSVTIGIITNSGTAVDLHEEVGAATAAVRAVNAQGGISGHQVKLDFCNEGLDPNKARACARAMVSSGVLAMAGDTVITAEPDVAEILGAAGVANVGPISFSGSLGSDPNSYLLSSGDQSAFVAAQSEAAVRFGGKRVAQFLLDSPADSNYPRFSGAVVRAAGGTYTGTVTAPQVTSDVSTQAAALMSQNPDVVLTNASAPASLGVIKDMVSLGYKGKFVSDGTQFKQADMTGLGSAADQVLVASPFPPLSATRIPGIQQFLKEMAAERASGDSQAPAENQLIEIESMSAWLAVHAIADIAGNAKATTAAEFKKAIGKAAGVSLLGVNPPWTPNKTVPGSAVPRQTDNSYYVIGWSNGKARLLTAKPLDATKLVNKYYK